MKKILAALLVVAMLSFISCSSKEDKETTTNSKQTTTSSVQETSETVTETNNVDDKATEVSDNTNDERYINWWGLNMYCPEEYGSDGMVGITQYYVRDYDTIEWGKSMNKKSMVFYTYAHSAVDTMDAEAVKKLMYDDRAIEHYGLSADYRDDIIEENEIQKEEKVTVNGCECIRQEGVFHCNDYIEPHDYFYVAYFGVIDFPMVGKQPAMMIAFTRHPDESFKAEVVHDIDTAAQNAAPVQ